MRILMLAAAAALVLSVQLVPSAKAEDTTVIKKDTPYGSKTVIKKDYGPAEEKKVIIHHDD